MDYSKGKIYKVVCSETQQVYIGSTTQPLYKRLYVHKCVKHNLCMTRNFINPKIFLIEDFDCKRKEQLESRERYYIENTECVNYHIPGRTRKEWTEKNKNRISKQDKEYYENNKDHILKQSKEYYKNNKDHILKQSKEYYKNNIDKRKKYNEKNKDKLSIQKKEIYEKNKKKLAEKITCECGSVVKKYCFNEHKTSKKHLNFLANK